MQNLDCLCQSDICIIYKFWYREMIYNFYKYEKGKTTIVEFFTFYVFKINIITLLMSFFFLTYQIL